MSKVMIYDRTLRRPMAVNEDGSINVNIKDMLDATAIQNALVEGLRNMNVEGIEVVLDKLVIVDYQEGDTDAVYNYPDGVNSIVLSNDSRIREKDFMFSVNNIEIRLRSGETFEGEFEKFDSISIANPKGAPYRLFIKKKVAGENV